MFLLGFILGLSIGLGFWLWQQVQLNGYLERVLQPLNSHADKIGFPLLPRLRQEMSMVRQQQQDLQLSLQTYQELLDFAPLGYLQVDEENQLLWCNQQAREILHLHRWQPGQVRLLLELVRSYELDQLIEQTRDWQKPQVREWIFHPSRDNAKATLELKPLALQAFSLPLPQRQVGVFLENHQPLLDMNQQRDRSFSDLAHELRTPLTSIRLVAETLQTRLDPPLDRWVNRLMQEVDRLINLVQSWLELTQMETNSNMLLNPEVVEVRSLIASVWETLEPLAQNQHLNISYSGLETVCIHADRSRMYQVFVNLLDNCIKYSPSHTTIYIEVNLITVNEILSGNHHSPALEINIIDSGLGFATADLPHVFERFYRGDKARHHESLPGNTTTAITGSGLGLAIVQQIIIAHGGIIKAMNHPDTGGAWIQIQLPEVVANSPRQDYS
ncbi:PAS domain-containing sensor histidine kinase [Sphaerospermopsis aphanizomenoides BCCUSP55]|uniref:sensor histidine kinase n=1 Tax=Sphaerospermopsis aphanizomenoides TaxID=459663 RepID=UPI000A736683|nr:PAS domain-containing sensor histidine kinase [Sphaerospermopsis aphanizomenoides]MBK1990582.1 PAS domain-containing sensor histidine kinase [Sphaerospermopsis aphanizomenoides BCCUSP55]